MLDMADIALLTVVLLILLISRIVTHIKLRRDWSRVQKYKLYSVRDKLTYLVATDKLDEQDFIFQTFYKATSYFIKATDTICLSTFVTAIQDARKKGLDPADKKKIGEIAKALQSKDETVVSAVNDFYTAIINILMENSFILRVYVKTSPFFQSLKEWADKLKVHLPRQRLYRIYLDYSHAATAIA